jgi:hypothetical protein
VRTALLIMTVALAACASSAPPMDAGVDLTTGQCDPRAVYADCSAQCQMPICIVASATCSASSHWICDCARTQACGADMRVSD